MLCPKTDERASASTGINMTLTSGNTVNSLATTPTAEVQILKGKLRRTVKALFDTGAQKTFISQDLVKAMKLSVVGKVNLAISGFLTNNETQTLDVVRPVVLLGRYKCKLVAVVKVLWIRV